MRKTGEDLDGEAGYSITCVGWSNSYDPKYSFEIEICLSLLAHQPRSGEPERVSRVHVAEMAIFWGLGSVYRTVLNLCQDLRLID